MRSLSSVPHLLGVAFCCLGLGLPASPAQAVCRVVSPPPDSPEWEPVLPAGDQPALVRVWPATRLLPSAETLIVGPTFDAVGGTFGLIVPVPSAPTVTQSVSSIFNDASLTTGPLVTYTVVEVEDPDLGYQCDDPHYSSQVGDGSSNAAGGCGGGIRPVSGQGVGGWSSDPTTSRTSSTEARAGEPYLFDYGVLGAYEVAILDGSAGEGWEGWLEVNAFVADADSRTVLQEYVAAGWYLVAVRVNAGPSSVGTSVLRPLAITFDTPSGPVVPGRIGWRPDAPDLSLDLWVVGETPFDVSSSGASEISFAGYPVGEAGALGQYLAESGTRLTALHYDGAFKPPLGIPLVALPSSFSVQEQIDGGEQIHYVPMACEATAAPSAGPRGPASPGTPPPIDPFLLQLLTALALVAVSWRRREAVPLLRASA